MVYFKSVSIHLVSFRSTTTHDFIHIVKFSYWCHFSFLYCSTGESEPFLTQLPIKQNAVENIMKCVVNIQWCNPTNTIWSMDARCAGYHLRQLEQYFLKAKWIMLHNILCRKLLIDMGIKVWIHVIESLKNHALVKSGKSYTVEPLYNEVLGTIKITLLYQVSHYIRVKKQRNIKNWDQQNYLVIRGFCYIRPLYNEVPLYSGTSL